jgi:hypothetical protein
MCIRNSWRSLGSSRRPGSRSGAELRPSSGRGRAAGPSSAVTVSRMSVTEAERSVPPPPPPACLADCRLRALPPSPSSTDSKSADLGRCLRRARKSIALLSMRNGFRLPAKRNWVMYVCTYVKSACSIGIISL